MEGAGVVEGREEEGDEWSGIGIGSGMNIGKRWSGEVGWRQGE